ncbi:hypothetical protein [Actinacidiphila acidipaludis]|uniref:Uncharacterized protein n=1 Tax=Actinacidiphila acidipaludis TaxID=2873382 RepID=A0ABS7QIR9_9ACTN|nr:hypothetical protein [Streptomyces acidipaludis]MBY8883071.1 hypothetical protein [Streptomyces acidipaludis]
MRRAWKIAAVGAVAAVAAAGGTWWWEVTPKYHVPVPPASAGPDTVVTAYMKALDAHDGATARALSTQGHRAATDGWLSDTTGMRVLKVSAPVPDGRRVDVMVTFDLRQHWWTEDASMQPGRHDWSYVLVREQGRWLVQDEGTG